MKQSYDKSTKQETERKLNFNALGEGLEVSTLTIEILEITIKYQMEQAKALDRRL
jgi:hypothetical protein